MSATDNVKTILAGNNVTFEAKAIQYGTQFRFADGSMLNVYDSGKKHWAGKNTDTREKIEKLIGSDDIHIAPAAETDSGHVANKKVFIVYGHDANAREQLELLLRRLRLEPVVLQNLPAAGETII
jgi:predicted nucleotide-binding protein